MKTRGAKAGLDLGKSIVEMANLMYQNNTAAHFYRGLFKIISEEMQRRNITTDAADSEGWCSECYLIPN